MKKASRTTVSGKGFVTRTYLSRALDERFEPVLAGINSILEELGAMRKENNELRQMREQLYSNDIVLERRIDHVEERMHALEIAK
jgi:hypothetical protein